MSISFFHIASVYPKATKVIIENVRKYHPNNYYFLAIDGNRPEYFDVAKEYNCDAVLYETKLGGCSGISGHNLEQVIIFLERFKEACQRCNTSHIIMMEDDVLILNPITIDETWEHACADTKIGNYIPTSVHDLIEHTCGKRPIFKQYGAGGGSIFKVSTFLENYNKVLEFFKKYFKEIQSYYPTIGYIDCYMNVYYYLCGKDYSVNPYRTDTHKHYAGYDYDSFVKEQSNDIQIINNYKKYYYE
jgi:hypothetical protein